LPVYMAREDPNLTQVLPELAGPLIQAYFVYPEELRHSKRIAVFRDFLLEKVAADNL
nr:LysR family transcriptional regulator [Alphaproteobacteria bacterium]